MEKDNIAFVILLKNDKFIVEIGNDSVKASELYAITGKNNYYFSDNKVNKLYICRVIEGEIVCCGGMFSTKNRDEFFTNVKLKRNRSNQILGAETSQGKMIFYNATTGNLENHFKMQGAKYPKFHQSPVAEKIKTENDEFSYLDRLFDDDVPVK